jgi:hypothetical protein
MSKIRPLSKALVMPEAEAVIMNNLEHAGYFSE